MSYRMIITLAGTLLLLTKLSSADEPVKPSTPTADRVKLVRQMYAKLPCEILGFVEPMKFVAAQKDGLSLMLLLQDANEKEMKIHLLGKFGETSNSLLVATGHLPPRGPEEAAVYGLLLRVSAKPADKTTQTQLQLLDAVLAVLDQRFAGAMPIPAQGAEK